MDAAVAQAAPSVTGVWIDLPALLSGDDKGVGPDAITGVVVRPAGDADAPLVLLPGRASASPVWEDNLPALLGIGDVYTIDLLGEPVDLAEGIEAHQHFSGLLWLVGFSSCRQDSNKPDGLAIKFDEQSVVGVNPPERDGAAPSGAAP